MNEKTFLNYQFQQTPTATHTMVFLHGLFGDMNNLGAIARAFTPHYSTLKVDLRNHGNSFHADEMNYTLMAQDVLALLQHLQLEKVILVGHSMGGKTAMALAELSPEKIEKIVVIDIAPVAYTPNRHDSTFSALFAVKKARPENRQQAKVEMAKSIRDESVQQFMLKSFDPSSPDCFKFNLTALKQNYLRIMDWQKVNVVQPTLFIKGELSDYLQDKDRQAVLSQFPNAKVFVVSNADHWVHAEKPETVIRAIERFIK